MEVDIWFLKNEFDLSVDFETFFSPKCQALKYFVG